MSDHSALSQDEIDTVTAFFNSVAHDNIISYSDIGDIEGVDVNADGAVSYAEKAACAEPWQVLFPAQDGDGSGGLTLVELLVYNAKIKQGQLPING